MKTMSIIFYVVGSILFIASCFTKGVAVTWWTGGISVIFLIAGCIFQFQANKTNIRHNHY